MTTQFNHYRDITVESAFTATIAHEEIEIKEPIVPDEQDELWQHLIDVGLIIIDEHKNPYATSVEAILYYIRPQTESLRRVLEKVGLWHETERIPNISEKANTDKLRELMEGEDASFQAQQRWEHEQIESFLGPPVGKEIIDDDIGEEDGAEKE